MKNKNILGLILIISFSSQAFGQVGINTQYPQGIFNVDGAKNNPATGPLTPAQQADDFVVTATGNVGVGTTVPAKKLHVEGDARITGLPGDNPLNTDYVVTVDNVAGGTYGDIKKVDPKFLFNSIDQAYKVVPLSYEGSPTAPPVTYNVDGSEDVIWMAYGGYLVLPDLPDPPGGPLFSDNPLVKRGRILHIVNSFHTDTYDPFNRGMSTVFNGRAPLFTGGHTLREVKPGQRISIVPVTIYGGNAWVVISSSFGVADAVLNP